MTTRYTTRYSTTVVIQPMELLKDRIDSTEFIASYGTYLIINHTLKELYVGVTYDSFIKAWSHLYFDSNNSLPQHFLHHKDTKLHVLRSGSNKLILEDLHKAHISIIKKKFYNYTIVHKI